MSTLHANTAVQDRKPQQLRRRRWKALIQVVHVPLDWIAGRPTLALLVPGILCFLLAFFYVRPFGFPAPRICDEFSYLLGSDTFASGRLANPTHPLWVHFESPFINQIPSYVSMYHPAQAMALAAGQRIAGHPWYGVLASAVTMCVAISWMLRTWLPPRWALLGSLVAAQIVVFGGWGPGMWTGYWVASYWGGTVAATGGALVIGALGRLRRQLSVRASVLFAVGVAILANSRPYEGLWLTITAMSLLAFKVWRSGISIKTTLQKMVLPAAVVMTITAAGMAYYCWRTTGNPLRLPYQEHLHQYMIRRMFFWGEHQPKVYRHESLAKVYKYVMREQLSYKRKIYEGTRRMASFYIGPVLAIPLLMIFWVRRDRRIWPVLICCGAVLAGVLLVEWIHVHYVAPILGALVLVSIQCLRHVATLRFRGIPAGSLAALLILSGSFVVSASGAWSKRGWHRSGWPVEREKIREELIDRGGKHLVVVRYSERHDPQREWVYNAADIDASPVIWAREMADNSALFKYFAGRRIWLLEVDLRRATIQPYPQP